MAQSIERPTLIRVMISQIVSLSPTLGSVLPAQSLEPASSSVSSSLTAPSPLILCLSLSKINIQKKIKKNQVDESCTALNELKTTELYTSNGRIV